MFYELNKFTLTKQGFILTFFIRIAGEKQSLQFVIFKTIFKIFIKLNFNFINSVFNLKRNYQLLNYIER